MSSTRWEHRPPILWPVILITVGILALLQNFGQLPGNFWLTIARLWPLILVLLGVEILIGQLRLPYAISMLLALVVIAGTIGAVIYMAAQSPEEIGASTGDVEHIERDLQGVTSAAVALQFGAGTLTLGSTGGSQLMAGDFRTVAGQGRPTINYSGSGGRGNLTIAVPKNQVLPFFNAGRGNEWNVSLNSGVPLSLRIDAGASTNELNLMDLKLTDLRVQAGVSTNNINLPNNGSYTARISCGLATTTINVPEGVAARIRIDGGMQSTSVDESRFPKSGDLYVSPNFDTATNKVDLQIDGGLATVSVN
jgi:hypothetical protein